MECPWQDRLAETAVALSARAPYQFCASVAGLSAELTISTFCSTI